eukprot:m.32894 g.32894  ORF g.32894 m.32894 type:complete len:319 (-) comp8464_c0_seq2:18-974(-)
MTAQNGSKDVASKKKKRGVFTDFVLAGSATSAAVIFTNPMEVVKTRMQMQGELQTGSKAGRHYRNVFHCFYETCRTEGLRGIQRGLVPGIMFQIAMNGTRLGLFPAISSAFGVNENSSGHGVFFRSWAAGACTGIMGGFIGSPFFLVKARIQNSGNPGAKFTYNYKGMLDGFYQVIKSEGFVGLFRGVQAGMLRVVVGSSTQLSSYHTSKVLVTKAGVPDGVPTHLTASLISGLIVTTAMNPFDVVSTRLYSQQSGKQAIYKTGWFGPIDCMIKIGKTEGIAGFFKGWTAHYFRLGPHTVLTFLFWEQTQRIATRFGY